MQARLLPGHPDQGQIPLNLTSMPSPPPGTFSAQSSLPKLPVPPLEDTCKRYLRALEGLQDKKERELTLRAVEDFLAGEGPKIQGRLMEYAKDKNR